MACELAFRHSSLKISFRELRFNHFYNRNSDSVRHIHCAAGRTGPGTFRNCVFIFSHGTALALKAKADSMYMERRLRQGSSASEETLKTENSFSQLTRFLSSTCVLRSFATAFFNFGYYKNALRITQESGLRNENKKRVGKRRENPRAMNCILMIGQFLEARSRRKSFIGGCLIEAE